MPYRNGGNPLGGVAGPGGPDMLPGPGRRGDSRGARRLPGAARGPRCRAALSRGAPRPGGAPQVARRAGALADRLGRTTLTIGAMAASGTSALLIGWLFGGPPWLVLVLALVWGVTVVADSAQFSVAVTELAPPGTAGSALAAQLGGGFVLTGATILLIGALAPADGLGWRLAFGALALGPAIGVVAMWRLRQRPESFRMAAGNR